MFSFVSFYLWSLEWTGSRLVTLLVFVDDCYFPGRPAAQCRAVCFAWNYLSTVLFAGTKPCRISEGVCPTESVRQGKALSADMEIVGL